MRKDTINTKRIDFDSKRTGVYVSTIVLYRMSNKPYCESEVGDKYFYSITHHADSISDADRKAKVYFADEIFKDDEIELFGVHSVFVSCELINKITNSIKTNKPE